MKYLQPKGYPTQANTLDSLHHRPDSHQAQTPDETQRMVMRENISAVNNRSDMEEFVMINQVVQGKICLS